MRQLPIFLCDYYKLCHADQYDERINKLVSYSTPRGCRLPGKDYVINFGIQAFCKKYLIDAYNKEFFRVPANEVERITRSFLTNTLPGVDVEKSVERIMKLHKLGYLPISIRTLPEGSKVSLKCPNVELVTTHPDFPWIGGYIESLFSSDSWKPMLDATVGHWYRETANKYYEMTSDNWQSKARSAMSEFGFRGADSPESGIGSGAAWLLSFNKTATCSAIPYISKYYNTYFPDEVADITEYINKYHEYLIKYGSEKLDNELNCFMYDNGDWHSYGCLDKETGKYVTALPLGYDKLPDWLIPRELWTSGKMFSVNDSELIIRENGKWTTIPFDIDVIGQGLISTEHSVMCSGVSLEMENILKGRIDITDKLSKSFIDDSGFERNCLGSLSIFIDNHINDENFDDVVKDLESNYYIKNPDTQEVFIIKYVMTDEDYKIKDGKKFQIMKFLSPCNLINIQKEAEKNVIKRLLTEVYPHSSFSMVSDSYDYWRMVTEILPELKDEIMNRFKNDKSPATLFVRGDSGDPVKIVAGYVDVTEMITKEAGEIKYGSVFDIRKFSKNLIKIIRELDGYLCVRADNKYYDICLYEVDDEIEIYGEIPSYIAKGSVECLWNIFNGTTNSKGYKVLDSHIRAIYGDSITQQRQEMIYKILEMKGFSVENVALGAGSFSFHAYEKDGVLYPYTRDTFQNATKSTYGEYSKKYVGSSKDGNEYVQTYENSYPIMIYKDPKTDSDNFKKSMKGCCAVYENDGFYYLDHDGLTLEERESDTDIAFEEIFKDGKMVKEVTFKEVREVLNDGKF